MKQFEKRKNCIVCQSENNEKLFDVERPDFNENLKVVKCCDCGLVFQLTDLNQEDISKYYGNDYYQHQSGWLEKILIDFLDNVRIREIEKYGKKGMVLDIGCGDGELLLKLKQQGWEVRGLDISLAAYEAAKKSLGDLVFNKDLKKCGFPGDFFDVVIMWHTLEHIFSPNELLAEIYRILKPDGVLVVEVPGLDSPVYKLTKQDYFSFDDPSHLYHFSARTLDKLLEINHFRVKKRGLTLFSLGLSLFNGLSRKLKRKLPFWLVKTGLAALSPFLLLLTLFFCFFSFSTLKGESLRVYCVKKKKYENTFG